MKTLKFLFVLLALSVCFVPGDAAADPPPFGDAVLKRLSSGGTEPKEGTGYIVGYETCGLSLETWDATGYYVISEDLKDTLAVYGLPKIFEFPAEAFPITRTREGTLNKAFPEKFRYAFKMRFTYTLSSEKEVVELELKTMCVIPADVPIQRSYRMDCVHVIINSAIKIE
jgi:hypothetical protein